MAQKLSLEDPVTLAMVDGDLFWLSKFSVGPTYASEKLTYLQLKDNLELVFHRQNGNTYGAISTIGTKDSYDLKFIANNAEVGRFKVSNSGFYPVANIFVTENEWISLNGDTDTKGVWASGLANEVELYNLAAGGIVVLNGKTRGDLRINSATYLEWSNQGFGTVAPSPFYLITGNVRRMLFEAGGNIEVTNFIGFGTGSTKVKHLTATLTIGASGTTSSNVIVSGPDVSKIKSQSCLALSSTSVLVPPRFEPDATVLYDFTLNNSGPGLLACQIFYHATAATGLYGQTAKFHIWYEE